MTTKEAMEQADIAAAFYKRLTGNWAVSEASAAAITAAWITHVRGVEASRQVMPLPQARQSLPVGTVAARRPLGEEED